MTYSIIIPTYNSLQWIKPCINSVLAQTNTAFNVIVLDSGSTDGTMDWISSLNDSRINIYATEKRLSITENWGRITTIPKNKFMTILGHDDILYPHYLETVEALIKQYPDAGLYQTHFNCIDENGIIIRPCTPMAVQISHDELLRHILQHTIDIVATGFMMLSEKYDAIGGIPNYPNLLFADSALWMNMVGNKYLAVSAVHCFEFRFHLANTSKSNGELRLKAFEMMIDHLCELKKESKIYKSIIEANAISFMKNYVTGSCHKLIYIPKTNRGEVSMKNIITASKKCADKLLPGNTYNPGKIPGVILAQVIDSNLLLRKLFLFYKSFSKRTF